MFCSTVRPRKIDASCGRYPTPQPCAAVHRQMRNVAAVQQDPSVIRRDQAGDDVETGGLSGAVRAQEPDNLLRAAPPG